MAQPPIELQQKIMGGTFIIKCFPQPIISRQQVQKCCEEAFAEAHRIEQLLTDFKASPFNEINYQAGKKAVTVNKEIWDIISYAQQLSKESNGLFDISYASLGHLWRAKKQDKKSINHQQWEEAKQFIDYKKIVLNSKNQSVFLPSNKMRIGLGGIGKGYAVDKIYEKLEQQGFENFYINGAGDIRVHSHTAAPRPWRIGIRNPFNKKTQAGFVQLTNQACATSGDYLNNIKVDGKKVSHHIINPHTGNYSQDIISSTVIADKAIIADTLATTSIIMGVEMALAFLNKKDLFAVLINQQGKVLLSNKAAMQYQTKD